MAQSQFSLCWDAHKKNICHGLSALQQNGEFVDMTLAADGHLVKVHQVILALASPYIKELISTANCPHPVILLNKMSYDTLSLILEYIYTGEVVVSIEHLHELINAAKELHIKGLEALEDMQNVPGTVTSVVQRSTKTDYEPNNIEEEEEEEAIADEYCYFEVTDQNIKHKIYQANNSYNDDKEAIRTNSEPDDQSLVEAIQEEDSAMQEEDGKQESVDLSGESHLLQERMDQSQAVEAVNDSSNTNISHVGMMQYTVSNQGSLQMILNRFVYYLKHTNRDGSRQWRCVDYLTASRCPATVVTKDDVVTHRIASHMHPFHDQKILKKVRSGAIFSAIKDAVTEGENKKSHKLNNEDKSKQIQV